MPVIKPYGSWPSAIGVDLLAAGSVGLSWPEIRGGACHWCESRPAEQGRTTLLRRTGDGPPTELTPAPWNVRTRINEYGGKPYLVTEAAVAFCHLPDQRLWSVEPGREPRPLTAETGAQVSYGDLELDHRRDRLLAVSEDQRGSGEPRHGIVAVPLDGSSETDTTLIEGPDFLASPRISADGSRLAWLSWDHPDMPWDASTLWLAALDDQGKPGAAQRIAGGPGRSIVQPSWAADGTLLFLDDRSGYWNLMRLDGGAVHPVRNAAADFGGPLWQLGASWYAPLADGRIAAAWLECGRWRLGVITADGSRLDEIALPLVEIAEVSAEGGRVLLRAGHSTEPASILMVDLATGASTTVARSAELDLAPSWISRGEAITATTPKGPVYALFYPPTNPDCRAPEDEHPPLIVRSHGGPTSRATAALHLTWQYWTSRGFAVVDVDYRGSTGYGRGYREALEGKWGIADVEDCVAIAELLVARRQADSGRLLIAGSSAGGFTTLCALTFTDVFAAGTSWYGVGDLEALAKDTHKFESRYLDRLIGPWPEAAEVYRARSALHHVDRLKRPVLFLQGEDDKVVPPGQAATMAAALRERGVPVAHLTFPGEGHGFRKAETIERALQAEHAFYCRVLGIEPGEELPPIEIQGM